MLTENNKRFEAEARRGRGGAWLSRAKRIEAALVRETWLPIGLRGLLVSELPEVKRHLRRGWYGRAQRAVHRLALTSFRYGPSLLESETLAQLRVLDLELSSRFEPEFVKTREAARQRVAAGGGAGR